MIDGINDKSLFSYCWILSWGIAQPHVLHCFGNTSRNLPENDLENKRVEDSTDVRSVAIVDVS